MPQNAWFYPVPLRFALKLTLFVAYLRTEFNFKPRHISGCIFYGIYKPELKNIMKPLSRKINRMASGLAGLMTLALALASGCVVEPDGRVGVGVVVAAPAVEVATIPDDYYWDGYEYVGLVGDQYYYLGPGNVWLVCDPVRLGHLHAWIGVHPDWHAHGVRNDHYRTDSRGRFHPRHDR